MELPEVELRVVVAEPILVLVALQVVKPQAVMVVQAIPEVTVVAVQVVAVVVVVAQDVLQVIVTGSAAMLNLVPHQMDIQEVRVIMEVECLRLRLQ